MFLTITLTLVLTLTLTLIPEELLGGGATVAPIETVFRVSFNVPLVAVYLGFDPSAPIVHLQLKELHVDAAMRTSGMLVNVGVNDVRARDMLMSSCEDLPEVGP